MGRGNLFWQRRARFAAVTAYEYKRGRQPAGLDEDADVPIPDGFPQFPVKARRKRVANTAYSRGVPNPTILDVPMPDGVPHFPDRARRKTVANTAHAMAVYGRYPAILDEDADVPIPDGFPLFPDRARRKRVANTAFNMAVYGRYPAILDEDADVAIPDGFPQFPDRARRKRVANTAFNMAVYGRYPAILDEDADVPIPDGFPRFPSRWPWRRKIAVEAYNFTGVHPSVVTEANEQALPPGRQLRAYHLRRKRAGNTAFHSFSAITRDAKTAVKGNIIAKLKALGIIS